MQFHERHPPLIVDPWVDWDWFRPLHRKLWLTSGLACSLRAGRNDTAAVRPSRAAGGSPRWRLARGRGPRHPLGRARRFDPVGLIAYSPHMEAAGPKLRIFVDADACPVKDEVYRIAALRADSFRCRKQPDRGSASAGD